VDAEAWGCKETIDEKVGWNFIGRRNAAQIFYGVIRVGVNSIVLAYWRLIRSKRIAVGHISKFPMMFGGYDSNYEALSINHNGKGLCCS